MDSPIIYSESIKQEAWHKQIHDEIATSKRPIDKMSVAEIRRMYLENQFLCDMCGKELEKGTITLVDHITHLINPTYKWCCEDCFQYDLRNNKIIAISGEPKPEKWQEFNK